MIIEDEVVYTSEYIDKLYHDEFDRSVELAISEGYVRHTPLTATREKKLFKLLLDLYHNEVDAHYNVEQFFNSEGIKLKGQHEKQSN